MPDIDIDPTTGAPVVKATTSVDTPTSESRNSEGVNTTGSTPTKVEKPVTTLPPVTPITPKVTAKVETKTVKKTEKELILDKLNTILAECGGLESNVGMTSDYWELQRKYRSL